jgi:hypothetical protein
VDVEPALADIIEGSPDDLLQTGDPSLLSCVEPNVGDAGGLDLFEFFNSQALLVGAIEDPVVGQQLVALCPDLDHGSDGLLFDVQRLEAEV